MKNWLVIANAARARVLEESDLQGAKARQQPYVHVADLVHPQSRQKGIELGGDRAGHAEGSSPGLAGAAYTPRTDPREREHDRFARQVAQMLDEGIAAHRCAGLVLVASSPFLGHLKAHLGEQAKKALVRTLDADYTALDDRELAQRLAAADDVVGGKRETLVGGAAAKPTAVGASSTEVGAMQLPLQITFRDMVPLPSLEPEVRRRVDKLAQWTSDVMSCHVAIEAAGNRHRQGHEYTVKVCVRVPDAEIAATTHHHDQDIHRAVHGAFDAVARQLEDYARQRRGQVKQHEPAAQRAAAQRDTAAEE